MNKYNNIYELFHLFKLNGFSVQFYLHFFPFTPVNKCIKVNESDSPLSVCSFPGYCILEWEVDYINIDLKPVYLLVAHETHFRLNIWNIAFIY